MCDTALAFGEGDTYLLECPSRRCFNDLPPGIVESLRDGDIDTTLDVAFGPGGSYVIAYRQPCSRGILMEALGVTPGLNKWLFEKNSSGQVIRSFAKLQVSLGPTKSRFWATDGSSWVWEGLPKLLQQKVTSMMNNGLWTTATPKLVSLGFSDDFVMIMESGNSINVFWDLPNYPDLEQSIKVVAEKERLADLRNISLNPFKKGVYTLVCDDILILDGIADRYKPAVEKLGVDIKSHVATTKANAAAANVNAPSNSARAAAQSAWDMEYNNPYSLVRYICKHCVRERGLCDCDVADYQVEHKFV
ncbi:hypothetical protein B0T25DRAFT_130404 [Lasiosphaeria hispida]|uniref:Uncharacterized protein n=1 Tax=Lasiosphaeria hispida TaxID=260671 RepID=A0AAJ0HSE2_9PEZI|nr:hypothetical protein B0T25DRAFT_130404 [Lasiosphaeria hispida]